MYFKLMWSSIWNLPIFPIKLHISYTTTIFSQDAYISEAAFKKKIMLKQILATNLISKETKGGQNKLLVSAAEDNPSEKV